LPEKFDFNLWQLPCSVGRVFNQLRVPVFQFIEYIGHVGLLAFCWQG
jgi:hypothetical protein